MDINISFSYSKSANYWDTVFYPADIDWSNINKILQYKGRYCMARFKDNLINTDNYIVSSMNTLVIDIDDGLTLEQFKIRADKWMYAVGTTQHHKLEKNNKIRDRFRVIIPCVAAISLNASEYSLMMSEVIGFFGADKSCKNVSHAYNGYCTCKVYTHVGSLFDWEDFYNAAIKRRKAIVWVNEIKLLYGNKTSLNNNDELFFKFAKSKFDKIYYSGNRNNAIADIVLWGKNNNISVDLLERQIRSWVNKTDDVLPDKEISMIFNYHRRK